MAHPWPETGMGLEQGLDLTDISRGRPGRSVCPQSSVALRQINIIYKLPEPLGSNPTVRGSAGSLPRESSLEGLRGGICP